MPAKTLLLLNIFVLLHMSSRADIPWINDAENISTGGNHICYDINRKGMITVNYVCPYLLKELSLRKLEILVPVYSTDISGVLEQSGDEIFNETLALIGAGKHLSEKIYLRVQCGIYSINSIANDGGTTVLANLQMLYKPVRNLIIGTYIFNPVGLEIKTQSIPFKTGQSFHAGFRYDPVENFSFIAEFSRFIGKHSRVSIGADYAILKTFHIRGGFSVNPVIPSWGIGWESKRLALSFALNRHPALGITPALSINYNLKSK